MGKNVTKLNEATLKQIIREEIENMIKENGFNPDSTRPGGGKSLTLYHGTKHDFIGFSNKNIGGGEGNQSFGYGLYFTDSPKIAEFYAEKYGEGHGKIYVVSVTGNGFLDWNKKFTPDEKMRLEKALLANGIDALPVKRVLGKNGIETQEMNVSDVLNYYPNGKFFYENFALYCGSDKDASDYLWQMGISGIRYSAGSFYNIGTDCTNYVVFDPADIKILKKIDINTEKL